MHLNWWEDALSDSLRAKNFTHAPKTSIIYRPNHEAVGFEPINRCQFRTLHGPDTMKSYDLNNDQNDWLGHGSILCRWSYHRSRVLVQCNAITDFFSRRKKSECVEIVAVPSDLRKLWGEMKAEARFGLGRDSNLAGVKVRDQAVPTAATSELGGSCSKSSRYLVRAAVLSTVVRQPLNSVELSIDILWSNTNHPARLYTPWTPPTHTHTPTHPPKLGLRRFHG